MTTPKFPSNSGRAELRAKLNFLSTFALKFSFDTTKLLTEISFTAILDIVAVLYDASPLSFIKFKAAVLNSIYSSCVLNSLGLPSNPAKNSFSYSELEKTRTSISSNAPLLTLIAWKV